MTYLIKPELVAPAGNLEKLQVALNYGADAVYLGTTLFGLRKHADNFTIDELPLAKKIIGKYNKKAYLILNGFAYNEDLPKVKKILKLAQKLQFNALIISDIGILQLAKEYTNLPIHISTQSSATNQFAVDFWLSQGAKRVILARELSIKEMAKITKETSAEIEVFVHGASCAGYAGFCTLSNYLAKRDANRGGCEQNCRHLFDYYDKNDHKITRDYLINIKDIALIRKLPQLIKAGIHAFKIEGRMKSSMYLATVVSVYRNAIDYCYDKLIKQEKIDAEFLGKGYQELSKIANRPFREDYKKEKNILYFGENNLSSLKFVGLIKKIIAKKWLVIDVRNPFKTGDVLEIMLPSGNTEKLPVNDIYDLDDNLISSARVNQLVKIQCLNFVSLWSLSRDEKFFQNRRHKSIFKSEFMLINGTQN